MNYRHQFHAGNFADAMKHALLVGLVRALQQKEKGFLYLDTHAGRGSYDLAAAAAGDSLARQPEWPGGVGRLWPLPGEETMTGFPNPVYEYVELLRDFDRRAGNLAELPRFYPGSPWIACLLTRPQDRLALCEQHSAEHAALEAELGGESRVSVHRIDGYGALRAMLPPAERRALVFVDPPFEAQDEFARIGSALAEGLRRFPGGVFAVWYPLTARARVEEFFEAVRALHPPPTLAVELTIAGERSAIKMRGCGLLVINPPWRFDAEAAGIVQFLAKVLAQEPGGEGRVKWIVREKA